MSIASREAERADLIRALAVLCEKPGPSHRAVAAALELPEPSSVEYTELFVHQMPPHASIYLDPRGQIGGDAGERIAGFWRAVGSVPPREPDHLAALLGLWAALAERSLAESEPERRALIDHSQRALVWEHLASWLTPYLMRVAELGDEPYPAWAGLLTEIVNVTVGEETSERPHHLVDEPQLPQEPGDLVPFLLAPVRSGLLLARADLKRAATEIGLGIRLGERAYSLRSLLEQSGGEVLTWLSDEARREAALFASAPAPALLRDIWSARAQRTAEMLET